MLSVKLLNKGAKQYRGEAGINLTSIYKGALCYCVTWVVTKSLDWNNYEEGIFEEAIDKKNILHI